MAKKKVKTLGKNEKLDAPKLGKRKSALLSENPTAYDPRFDPASDKDSQAAHDGDFVVKSDKDDEDTQALVQRAIEEAVQDYQENLEQDQVDATDRYYGRPFGNERDGRSKVVSTDIRDATQAQLPSLMDVFFGPERVVEFKARGPEDEALAKQQTDYINFIVQEDNPGFLTLFSTFKDALVRRLGIVKWWWEDVERVTSKAYTGLGEMELAALAQEKGVEMDILGIYQTEIGLLYDARIKRTAKEGRARFAALPPEEWMITPGAREIETAPLVAHVREVPKAELIELGIDEDDIEEVQAEEINKQRNNSLTDARRFDSGGSKTQDAEKDRDESLVPVIYAEAYMLMADAKGRYERRLFQCIGSNYKIVGPKQGELVDDLPFAIFTPDPEPHTIVGLSNYDYLKDVELIKSQIQRGTLDSLAQSLDGAITEVVESKVNMADVLSTDVSRVVRSKVPQSINFIRPPFAGADTLPVLAYFDEVIENRTGKNRGAMGIDADALQSSTKAAVSATLTASQQRIKLLARIFAETGMKQLFKGLLRLVCTHQDKARVVRLRNSYVAVDPRYWDSTMDVQVNVGLGQGTPEEKIQQLMAQFEMQLKFMEMRLPFVSPVELRATASRMAELAGFKSGDEFYKPWGPEQQQQMEQQQAQQPPPPSPEMALVKIEEDKARSQDEIARAKLDLEMQIAIWKNDYDRDKLAREMALKENEVELKFHAEIEDSRLAAKVQADRVAMDSDLKREEMAVRREEAAKPRTVSVVRGGSKRAS